MNCPKCDSNQVIKKGKRKLKHRTEQVFYCNNCGKKFVSHSLRNKSYDSKVIIEAIKLYNEGRTLTESAKQINKKFKVKTSKSTVHNWIQEYHDRGLCGYLKRRDQHQKKYGKDFIKEKEFRHSDLKYLFKFHQAKLEETKSKFPELTEYVSNLTESCPDKLFNNSKNRSSKLDLNISQDLDLYRTSNKACELTDFVLKGNRNRRRRHEQVQDFMLKCDTATLAVEVPVWWYHKEREMTVTGHIDLIQERAGKIFILDYKPKAEEKKPFSQLYSYARGISYRTEIPFNKIKAAWFNENVYKEFTPSKI